MKRFVITGASTFAVKNMGDDAMLAALTQGLTRTAPGCEITFLARHPDPAYDKAFGFRSLKNLDHDTRDAAAGRFFWGMNRGDPSDHLRAICEAIAVADLLVIGGNSFMEISPNTFLRGVSSYGATLATLARFLGTPIALFGLNVVDDIRSEVTRQHALFMCGCAQRVSLREESGREFLAEVGVGGEHIAAFGDPAYAMKLPAGSPGAEAVLQRCSLRRPPGLLLGVGFRHEYWGGDDDDFAARAERLAKQLDQVVAELDAHLLFIPNCTYTAAHPWQDDRKSHRQIVALMQRGERAMLVEEDLNVYETFALFDGLDLHLSNRRHSCIFAAMNGVPFLSIEGPLKGHMPPFLEELGVPAQAVRVETDGALPRKMVETWKASSELRETLATRVQMLAERARQHVPWILGSP